MSLKQPRLGYKTWITQSFAVRVGMARRDLAPVVRRARSMVIRLPRDPAQPPGPIPFLGAPNKKEGREFLPTFFPLLQAKRSRVSALCQKRTLIGTVRCAIRRHLEGGTYSLTSFPLLD